MYTEEVKSVLFCSRYSPHILFQYREKKKKKKKKKNLLDY